MLCKHVFTVRLGLLIRINLILIPIKRQGGENDGAAPLGVTLLQGSRAWEEAPAVTLLRKCEPLHNIYLKTPFHNWERDRFVGLERLGRNSWPGWGCVGQAVGLALLGGGGGSWMERS